MSKAEYDGLGDPDEFGYKLTEARKAELSRNLTDYLAMMDEKYKRAKNPGKHIFVATDPDTKAFEIREAIWEIPHGNGRYVTASFFGMDYEKIILTGNVPHPVMDDADADALGRTYEAEETYIDEITGEWAETNGRPLWYTDDVEDENYDESTPCLIFFPE